MLGEHTMHVQVIGGTSTFRLSSLAGTYHIPLSRNKQKLIALITTLCQRNIAIGAAISGLATLEVSIFWVDRWKFVVNCTWGRRIRVRDVSGAGKIFTANLTMAKAGEPVKGTEVDKVTLWGFYNSSCTWRVRLALGLKGIPFEYKALNLSAGEHKSEEFKKISPLQYVPAVEVDGVIIADSIAIIMYFEEKFPDKKPMLPVDLVERAIVRQVVYMISANIQPLQNLAILKMIEAKLGADARLKWAQDHINIGFTALEQLLKKIAGKYTFGDELTLADVVLMPQIENANRYKVDMTPYPIIDRIGKALLELPEVQASLPANQPDFPK